MKNEALPSSCANRTQGGWDRQQRWAVRDAPHFPPEFSKCCLSTQCACGRFAPPPAHHPSFSHEAAVLLRKRTRFHPLPQNGRSENQRFRVISHFLGDRLKTYPTGRLPMSATDNRGRKYRGPRETRWLMNNPVLRIRIPDPRMKELAFDRPRVATKQASDLGVFVPFQLAPGEIRRGTGSSTSNSRRRSPSSWPRIPGWAPGRSSAPVRPDPPFAPAVFLSEAGRGLAARSGRPTSGQRFPRLRSSGKRPPRRLAKGSGTRRRHVLFVGHAARGGAQLLSCQPHEATKYRCRSRSAASAFPALSPAIHWVTELSAEREETCGALSCDESMDSCLPLKDLMGNCHRRAANPGEPDCRRGPPDSTSVLPTRPRRERLGRKTANAIDQSFLVILLETRGARN